MSDSDFITQLASQLGAALRTRAWMAVTAESCTAGGVAEAITRVAGSSAWFDRGFVTYSNEAKIDLLAVKNDTLAQHGAVSEATAREMALGALAASHADIAVSVTGIAGPDGGSPEKPVGTVCFGVATRDGAFQTSTEHFNGDRAAVREHSVVHALRLLIAAAR